MEQRTRVDCLERAIGGLGTVGAERRHEALVQQVVDELGLDRGQAEQIYALAEQERLEPAYAFEMLRCNVGVRQLEVPEQDVEEGTAAQQAPPAWLDQKVVALDDAALERRLRLSFRRFRTLIETRGDAVAAARAFVLEPDVGPLRPD